jgi:ribonuclease-3
MNHSDGLQTALAYRFSNPSLLLQALTHSSYVYEHKLGVQASNERLEFLGDAVLEVCISHILYNRYPALPEGKLTQNRASLVCEPTLAAIARGLSLGGYMRMGHGEELSGGREKGSLLSDALESVFGAVYLDGGFEGAYALAGRLFEPYFAQTPVVRDYKTTLQEILQKNSRETAVYHIISEEGPPHQRVFVAQVAHCGNVLAEGTGTGKKTAEQNAAAAALQKYYPNMV